MDLSICPKCGGKRVQRYRAGGGKCGWYCRGCNRERSRDESAARPEKVRARNRRKGRTRRSKPGHALKHAARAAVWSAIESGRMERGPCGVCGDPKSQTHHHLGYAREYWYDVRFLCQTHHSEAERLLREARREALGGCLESLPPETDDLAHRPSLR